MKTKKLLIACFMFMMIFTCFTPHATAASISYYQTSKADVPIWSAASSSSTKRRTEAVSGTVLKVVGSTINSAGNKWYKLSDGNWVYSGNVKAHTHAYNSGGICTGRSFYL